MQADMGESTVLRVVRASRVIGHRAVLSEIGFVIERSQIFGLLGPNGAGKTSLIRAISGRLKLDSGTIELSGESPRENRQARRRLGLVPQEIALYSELTARENLAVFARLMGVSREEITPRVDWALERIGLLDRADDRVQTLSGGMRRRINIAAGILHNPEVLLLDEPTVGVDPSAREKIHEFLLELREEGLAILLTTHDLEQAAELSDRIGILVDGKLCASGSLDELIRKSFGDSKELTVTLSKQPGESGRSWLETRGLIAARDGKVWTGRLQGGLGNLSDLGNCLEKLGLSVEEIRVREPNLRGVFFHLAGREFDA
jgi:ABC-2 type transport system ATP-binding protein